MIVGVMAWNQHIGLLLLLLFMIIVVNVNIYHVKEASKSLQKTIIDIGVVDTNAASIAESESESSSVCEENKDIDWKSYKITTNIAAPNGWASFDVRNDVYMHVR